MRIFGNLSLASIVRMAVDGIGILVLFHVVACADLDAERLLLLDGEHTLPPLRFSAGVLETSVS